MTICVTTLQRLSIFVIKLQSLLLGGKEYYEVTEFLLSLIAFTWKQVLENG